MVEPEGAGAEFAEEREAYLEVFDRCVANNCGKSLIVVTNY